MPDDGALVYRTGTYLYGPDEEQWAAGDRGVRCLLWLSNRDLTRSVKGAGTKGLPVR